MMDAPKTFARSVVDKMIAEAVAAERERCAAYVEDYLRTWNDGKWADELAALIRKGE
jgi:hypothetical protein